MELLLCTLVVTRLLACLQAGTTFKVTVCTAVPLTETLALQQAALARPYSRVVFIMDYADSPLLHSIEEAVRSQNVRCLGLHKTPAGTVSRNRAASVYGGASRAAGKNIPPCLAQPAVILL